jgi:hypothetical protein
MEGINKRQRPCPTCASAGQENLIGMNFNCRTNVADAPSRDSLGEGACCDVLLPICVPFKGSTDSIIQRPSPP